MTLLIALGACQNHAPEPVRVAVVNIPMAIALGDAHSCVVLDDATVRCFGSNTDGQLGVAGIASSPRPLATGVHAVGIAAGAHHSCAIAPDATVACWGAGSATSRAVPGLAHVVQLVAGGDRTCARLVDGSVACWTTGQAPVPIAGLAGVTQLAASATHACALVATGEVRCWGDNQLGQLGDGTRISRPAPVTVANLSALAIAAGNGHTCAIAQDHLVRCWGDASPNAAAPTSWVVPGLVGAVQVAVGPRRSFARLASGEIVGWTNDWRYDPAEMDTLDQRPPPVAPRPSPVVGLTGATDLVAGPGHACARLVGRAIWCWGDDAFGQRGDGTASNQTEPVGVTGLHDSAQLGLGGEHSCAVLRDGTLRCWGSGDEAGQLGDGTSTDHPVPTPVPGVDHVVALALGNYHTCALRGAGELVCWGNVALFPLPNGSAVQGTVIPTTIPLGHPVVEIAAGGGRTCVRDAHGAIACWDLGSRGPTPVTVAVKGATAMSVGERHACALLADATIACWGQNANGMLGDGTRTDAATPTRVTGIATATQVAVGFTHTCALLRDRTVACWGQNDFGQLGSGATALSLTPVAVPDLTNVVRIGAGAWSTCALLGDGQVRCWGMGSQLRPTAVANLSGVVELAVGYMHACARLADGSARCWGTNRSGQLGDGTSLELDVPTEVRW